MKKLYKVTVPFWREGNIIPAGTEIALSNAAAKYLGHVLEEVIPKVEEPAAQPDTAEPDKTRASRAGKAEGANGEQH